MFNKKCILALFLLAMSAVFASPALAQYTPLVRLPGLPATGPISLSMYLVGLYNFMVSIVGIVAVMMMIIGGMRYITAGGSSSAISEAKDIISNAIWGLVIAIFAWVFVSAINPDVLYIKKPGLTAVTITANDCINTVAGSYVAPTTCICADGADISVAGAYPARSDCDNACKAGSHCVGSGNFCVRGGVNDTASSRFNTYPNNGKCMCIDGADIAPAGATCQASCATANCIKVDFRIGLIADNDVQAWAIVSEYERVKKYASFNPSFVDPLKYNVQDPATCNVALAINAIDYTVTNGATPSFSVDLNPAAGNPNIITAAAGPYATSLNGTSGYIAVAACILPTYNMLTGESECKTEFWSSGLLCPVTVAADFGGGIVKKATKYIKLFKP